VNPRYTDVLGFPCYPSVSELPDTVDCIVIAIPARAACDVMEQAFARGIRAAIVLAAGFDDDGPDRSLGARLRAMAQQGCPSAGRTASASSTSKTSAVAFNGVLPKTLHPDRSHWCPKRQPRQFRVGPLMRDRKLGSPTCSCGNQAGATIETMPSIS
jgi:hypothetical protein